MSPETNRFVLRSSWVIAGALWAVSLWMWFDIRDAAAPPAATSPPQAAARVALPNEAADDKSEEVLAAERPRPAARADTPAPLRSRAVCGLEPVAGRASTEAEIQAFIDEQRRLGHARVASALEQRGDAASQSLRALLDVLRGLQAEPLDCEPGAHCSARLQAAVLASYQRAPQPVDALLQLAQGSTEPLIMQTALLVCDAQRAVPKGCAGLSPRRLTQLDPDNAAAWLELAAREPAAADEALYRASLATRWDNYAGRVIVQADEAMPGDLTPLLSGYFDTATGAKGEPGSYAKIASTLALPAAAITFFSDAPAETDAALAAGMGAYRVDRTKPPSFEGRAGDTAVIGSLDTVVERI